MVDKLIRHILQVIIPQELQVSLDVAQQINSNKKYFTFLCVPACAYSIYSTLLEIHQTNKKII
jgi:hypothetical protein